MRFTGYIVAASTLLTTVFAGLEDVKYSVKLTGDNFDSSVAGKNSIVAFFAPWCGHCKNLAPVWEKLAKDFEDEETVLIGHLDADNAENRPVANRYDVKGYPTIKWFPADGSTPRDYQSGRTEDAFLDFINKEAGTHRSAGGLLNDLAGRIPSLDALVATFLSTGSDARDSLVSQAQDLSSQFSGSSANATAASYYLKVLEKVGSSSDWAQTELARLQKLASKRGAMAGKQLDDLQIRQNILAAFTAAKASGSSMLSDASASIDSATAAVGASASSASSLVAASASSASSVVASAVGIGGDSVSSVSSEVPRAASSVSSVVAGAVGAGGGVASSASSVLMGSASSASQVVSGVVGENAGYPDASSASAYASSASQQAEGAVSGAMASGKSIVSEASKSIESAFSAASASIGSGVSAASAAASTGVNKVIGEL